MKKVIHTEKAPKAVGPYSQAISTGNLLFTAGQVAMDPRTGKLVDGGIKEQTRQVMENLKAVLAEARTDFSRVVKATVFLQDIKSFADFNEVPVRASGAQHVPGGCSAAGSPGGD